MPHISKLRLATALLLTLPLLNACSPILIASGAVGAGTLVALDRRHIENMFEDQAIELRATDAIYSNKDIGKRVKIDITSFNGIVLLTGTAETDEMREHAGHIVYAIRNVREVYNEIKVGRRPNGEESASDTWITTKAKTLLVGKRGFPTHTKVITVEGTIYLMGLATGDEAKKAQEALANVGGVKDVITLFEPLDTSMQNILRASAEKVRKVPHSPKPIEDKAQPPSTPQEDDDVQIMNYKIDKFVDKPSEK